MDEEKKHLIIIDTALEKYRDKAVRKVKRSMCLLCQDKRCKGGKRCDAYEERVRDIAWQMVSHENN